MTDRVRVMITVTTALVLGGAAYGNAVNFDPLGSFWNGALFEVIPYGLGIAATFLVYRWWALLPAIAPVLVTVFLHNVTDYVSPWHEEAAGTLSENPASILLVILAVMINATVLSIGLGVRATWERIRPAVQAHCTDTPR